MKYGDSKMVILVFLPMMSMWYLLHTEILSRIFLCTTLNKIKLLILPILLLPKLLHYGRLIPNIFILFRHACILAIQQDYRNQGYTGCRLKNLINYLKRKRKTQQRKIP